MKKISWKHYKNISCVGPRLETWFPNLFKIFLFSVFLWTNSPFKVRKEILNRFFTACHPWVTLSTYPLLSAIFSLQEGFPDLKFIIHDDLHKFEVTNCVDKTPRKNQNLMKCFEGGNVVEFLMGSAKVVNALAVIISHEYFRVSTEEKLSRRHMKLSQVWSANSGKSQEHTEVTILIIVSARINTKV